MDYRRKLTLVPVTPDPATGYRDGGFALRAEGPHPVIANLGSHRDCLPTHQLLEAAYNAYVQASERLGWEHPLELAQKMDLASRLRDIPLPLSQVPRPESGNYHQDLELRPSNDPVSPGYELVSYHSAVSCTAIADLNPHPDAMRTHELLAAAYNSFERAGRELDRDPLELARTIDLATVYRLSPRAPRKASGEPECLRSSVALPPPSTPPAFGHRPSGPGQDREDQGGEDRMMLGDYPGAD